MKILVTGGAGYKGIPLVTALLNDGHKVTILDNFMYGFEPVLHLVENPALSIIKLDIRNITKEILKDFDMIYHLAGLSGYPACEANPHSAKLINSEASATLGKMLHREQRLVYASTTSFYGKSGDIRREDSKIEPVSMYGLTKYHAEQSLMERENSIALRFATVFGVSPKMRVDLLVNDFTYKAIVERCIVMFQSRSKRTFIHIKDAINAYMFTMNNFEKMSGQIFNVGNNSMNYTKLEIAEHIKKATNCTIIDSDIEDFDVRHFEIDFEKITSLGYSVQNSLDEGIAQMVKLYDFYRSFSPYKTI